MMSARAPMAPPAIKLPPAEVAATVPLSGLRGIIAERMAASAHSAARVTLVTEVDATSFVEARTRLKEEVSEDWGFAPGYTDLLATIVATLFTNHSLWWPITSDPGSWYAGQGYLGLAVLVALAAYGFYLSMAGRSLMAGDGILAD